MSDSQPALAFPPVEDQLKVILRGVEKVVPEEELARKLAKSRETGRPLRIKYGIDPTGIDVHLGHTVPLRKLRQFQELGHQAVLIIGNFTAMVGDPSGRDQARAKRLSAEEVEANATDYLKQVGKVIDLSKTEIHRNGEWFSKMTFADILTLCSKVTVAQLLTRDDFAKRYASQSPIFLHECLYPVMQAWDSVEIKSDIELGGTEQLYSFMLARDLQRDQQLEQQLGVMSPILVGLDGKRRMGKSLGNYIGIAESPLAMMKKFMQIPDEVMPMYFELLTNIPLDEVQQLLAGHPKLAKQRLAREVIAQYHTSTAGDEAIQQWEAEVSAGALPADIEQVTLEASLIANGTVTAAILFKQAGLCPTTSDARRLISQGGAYFGDDLQVISSHDQAIPITNGLLLKAGKKRYARLNLPS